MDIQKIFTLEELMVYTENDAELASQMIQMALKDIPSFYNSARMHFIDNRTSEVLKFIHKIKGIAGVVGAEELLTICLNSEKAIKSDSCNTENSLENLKQSIDRFCTYRDVLNTAG